MINNFSEILQIINRLNGKIDLDQVLTHAQSLLAKIKITISNLFVLHTQTAEGLRVI